MEINKVPNRIHPLVAIAAVSVTLLSLAGVASITGLLPSSHGTTAPAATPTAPAAADAGSSAAATDLRLADSAKPAASTSQPPTASSASQPARTARATHSRHSQPNATHDSNSAVVAQAPKICASCGQVESVQALKQEAKPSGLGIAAGAVLGGVLGNQVGGGNGRTLATVAGAVGGGYAGNEVEKRTRATTSYQIRVRMEDGSIRTFHYSALPGWNPGDRVRVVNGSLAARE